MSFYVWSLLDHERNTLLVALFDRIKDYDLITLKLRSLLKRFQKSMSK